MVGVGFGRRWEIGWSNFEGYSRKGVLLGLFPP